MYSQPIIVTLIGLFLSAIFAFWRERKGYPVPSALFLGITIGMLVMWAIGYILSPQPTTPSPTPISSPVPSPVPTEVLQATWIEHGQAAPFLDSRALIKCDRITYYDRGDASNYAKLVVRGTDLYDSFNYFEVGEQRQFTVSGVTYVVSLLDIEQHRVKVAIAESEETGD